MIYENIPQDKFDHFHAILCRTGGYYAQNPIVIGNIIRVVYIPGDREAMEEQWSRIITPIRETRRDQWWRKILRRVGIKV